MTSPFVDHRMRPVRPEDGFRYREPQQPESVDGRHWALSPSAVRTIRDEVAAGVRRVPPGFEQLTLEAVCEVTWQCQAVRSRRMYGAPAVTEAFRPNGKPLPLESWAGDGQRGDIRVRLGHTVTPGTYITVEIESYAVPVSRGQYQRPSWTDVHSYAERDARQAAEWYFKPSPGGVESPCWRAGDPWPEDPPPVEERPLTDQAKAVILAVLRRDLDESWSMSDSVRPELRERRLVFEPGTGQLVGRGLIPSGFGRFADWPPGAFLVLRYLGLRPDEVEEDLNLVRVGDDGIVRWAGTPMHLIPA